jgi:hypothetical protein
MWLLTGCACVWQQLCCSASWYCGVVIGVALCLAAIMAPSGAVAVCLLGGPVWTAVYLMTF